MFFMTVLILAAIRSFLLVLVISVYFPHVRLLVLVELRWRFLRSVWEQSQVLK